MNANRYRIGAVAAAVGLLLASAAGADRAWDFGDGRPTMELSGRRGEEIHFRIHVAPGSDRLVITTAGGSGDCDLYLAFDRQPTPKDYLQRSAGKATDELIVVERPQAGTWQLLVHAYDRFAGVALGVGAEPRPVARLRITSPSAGDVWRMGGEYTVTWRAGPRVRNVRVQLSFNDGRTWQRGGLSVTVPADRERLRIRLPRSPRIGTHEARVRILDADRQVVLDTSERFRIVARPILLPRRPVVIVLRRLPSPRPRRPATRKPPRPRQRPTATRRPATRKPPQPRQRPTATRRPATRKPPQPRQKPTATRRPATRKLPQPRQRPTATRRPAPSPAPRATTGSRAEPAEGRAADRSESGRRQRRKAAGRRETPKRGRAGRPRRR